jgi:DNA-binding phage protein
MKLKSFSDTVSQQLKDPEFAMAYLQVSLEEEGIPGFLTAFGKYVKANGRVQWTAEQANLRREAVSRMLSKYGYPEIRSLETFRLGDGL